MVIFLAYTISMVAFLDVTFFKISWNLAILWRWMDKGIPLLL